MTRNYIHEPTTKLQQLHAVTDCEMFERITVQSRCKIPKWTEWKKVSKLFESPSDP